MPLSLLMSPSLHNNSKIGPEGASAIAEVIKDCKSLRYLK